MPSSGFRNFHSVPVQKHNFYSILGFRVHKARLFRYVKKEKKKKHVFLNWKLCKLRNPGVGVSVDTPTNFVPLGVNHLNRGALFKISLVILNDDVEVLCQRLGNREFLVPTGLSKFRAISSVAF
uniref:Uncharacterized protein n=1 Tax=Cacopsylla melanoneura TaxID=428564 RepID=A0A8D8S0R8_9HEMI